MQVAKRDTMPAIATVARSRESEVTMSEEAPSARSSISPLSTREHSAAPSDGSELLNIDDSLTPVLTSTRKRQKRYGRPRHSALSQSIVIDSDEETYDPTAPDAGQKHVLASLLPGATMEAKELDDTATASTEKEEVAVSSLGDGADGKTVTSQKADGTGGEEGSEKGEEGAERQEQSESDEDSTPKHRAIPEPRIDTEDLSNAEAALSPQVAQLSTNAQQVTPSWAQSGSLIQADPAAESTATLSSRKRRRESDDSRDEKLRELLIDEDATYTFLATRFINVPELQRLEKLGIIQYKRGKYLESERRAIREHLIGFQQTHGISDEELIGLVMSKGRWVGRSDHSSFWFDIAATVPGRPVAYVKDAVKRMYDPRGRKGMWTTDEDQALLRAYTQYPNQWTEISNIVDRSELDCRDRWKQELRDRATRNKGKWSPEETDQLIAAVNKVAADLSLDVAGEGLPWDTIVQLMNRKRTTSQCRKKWRDHLMGSGQLTLPQPTRSKRLDPRLVLQRFRELDVQHENDIAWHDLPTPEWKVKPAALRTLWCTLKKSFVIPDRTETPFQELLDRIETGLDASDKRVGTSGTYRLPNGSSQPQLGIVESEVAEGPTTEAVEQVTDNDDAEVAHVASEKDAVEGAAEPESQREQATELDTDNVEDVFTADSHKHTIIPDRIPTMPRPPANTSQIPPRTSTITSVAHRPTENTPIETTPTASPARTPTEPKRKKSKKRSLGADQPSLPDGHSEPSRPATPDQTTLPTPAHTKEAEKRRKKRRLTNVASDSSVPATPTRGLPTPANSTKKQRQKKRRRERALASRPKARGGGVVVGLMTPPPTSQA